MKMEPPPPPHDSPSRHSPLPGGHLGTLLVAAGKLGENDVHRILALQRREGWRFGEAAVRLSLITEGDLAQALCRQYGLPDLPGDGGGMISAELIAACQPGNPRTDELRALRARLLIDGLRHAESGTRTLAVVSPGAGEGRSFVVANLAILFAQLGERTLLIDADLRQPRLHRMFNLPDRHGLGGILAGRLRHPAALPVPGIANLMLLPAGAPPPNPLELLSRPTLPALLAACRQEFDTLLIDTPPAGATPDAQTIAFRAGHALVLARRHHTRLSDARQLVDTLLASGTRVVGTVLNSP